MDEFGRGPSDSLYIISHFSAHLVDQFSASATIGDTVYVYFSPVRVLDLNLGLWWFTSSVKVLAWDSIKIPSHKEEQ